MRVIKNLKLVFLIILLTTASSISIAKTGSLFNISVNNTILNVNTTPPNHTYKSASFQITTPGYIFSDGSCDSTTQNGAVCIFSISDTRTRSFSIQGPIGTFKAKFCLNSAAPFSCENYTGSIQNGNLNAVSCSNSGQNCTAGGYYVSSYNPAGFPESDYGSALIYTSSNGGASWSAPMTPVSPSPLTQILGLTCSSDGSLCHAVGYTLNTSLDQNQAIIYTSSNGIWDNLSPIYAPLPEGSNTYFSRLNDISCNADGTSCVAVGWSQSNGQPNEVPYTIYYENGSWQLSTQPSVPSGYGRVITYGVSCIQETPTNCVIAGYAINSSSVEVPVIYFSITGGHTWGTAVLPTPPTNSTSSHFESVGCAKNGSFTSGTTCAAVGVATLNTGITSPIIYISTNPASWSQITTNTPSGSAFGILFGVSCNDNTSCTTVGGYNTSSGLGLPLTYYNAGLPNPVLPLAPTSTTGSTLFGVFSTNTFSIAVGSDSVGVGKLPLVYTSNNFGASWSNPLTLNVPIAE